MRIYHFDGGVDETTLWLVDDKGCHIAKVEKFTMGHCRCRSCTQGQKEQWQKIVDTIVAAPGVMELAKKQDEALRLLTPCTGEMQIRLMELIDKMNELREKYPTLFEEEQELAAVS